MSDFVGEQSRVHIMPISAKWKHKSSIHIGFIVFNGGVTTFFAKSVFYVLLLHKANIFFLKNFLINAQLADFFHHGATKLKHARLSPRAISNNNASSVLSTSFLRKKSRSRKCVWKRRMPFCLEGDELSSRSLYNSDLFLYTMSCWCAVDLMQSSIRSIFTSSRSSDEALLAIMYSQIFQYPGLVLKGLIKVSRIKLDTYSLQTMRGVKHSKEYVKNISTFHYIPMCVKIRKHSSPVGGSVYLWHGTCTNHNNDVCGFYYFLNMI